MATLASREFHNLGRGLSGLYNHVIIIIQKFHIKLREINVKYCIDTAHFVCFIHNALSS